MAILRVRAKGTGRVVRYSALKRGELVETTRLGSLFFSTTLPDVMTDVLAAAEEMDPNRRVTAVVPNGPATASLDLAITGLGFELLCSRRLVRGLFPLNPLAAEFGSNYDVSVSIKAAPEVEARLVERLQVKYVCSPDAAPGT
ncbi:MAG: hypothetical protein ACRC8S_14330 [Fimbriiglobus sp.]